MTVYVVGRNDISGDDGGAWEVLGVYTTRELAIARCTEITDWIGPVELDKDLPDASMTWPGAWYPALGVGDDEEDANLDQLAQTDMETIIDRDRDDR